MAAWHEESDTMAKTNGINLEIGSRYVVATWSSGHVKMFTINHDEENGPEFTWKESNYMYSSIEDVIMAYAEDNSMVANNFKIEAPTFFVVKLAEFLTNRLISREGIIFEKV